MGITLSEYSPEEAALHQAWVNRELAARSDHDDTLSIDIYDTQTKRSIWHGIAPVPIVPHTRQAVIEHEVNEVLRLFPPKKLAVGPSFSKALDRAVDVHRRQSRGVASMFLGHWQLVGAARLLYRSLRHSLSPAGGGRNDSLSRSPRVRDKVGGDFLH